VGVKGLSVQEAAPKLDVEAGDCFVLFRRGARALLQVYHEHAEAAA